MKRSHISSSLCHHHQQFLNRSKAFFATLTYFTIFIITDIIDPTDAHSLFIVVVVHGIYFNRVSPIGDQVANMVFYGSRCANVLIKGYNQIKQGIDYMNSDGIPPAESKVIVHLTALAI